MANEQLRVVRWSGLPEDRLDAVFPDAVRLGTLEVGTKIMPVYRFLDGAGHVAFALRKDGCIVSNGPHVLDSNKIRRLRKVGAAVVSI